jgi:DNA-binding response OmpR family regulator
MGARILIVVHDEATRRHLASHLRRVRHDWKIAFEHAPESAWTRLGGSQVDAVLIDSSLPDGAGFRLLERIRELGTTADLPVAVLMSGSSE